MEERKKTGRVKSKNGPKGDYLTRVTLLQTAVCLLLSLVCFAISRGSGDAQARLRTDFEALMQWEITVQDVRDVWHMLCEKLETAEVFGNAAAAVYRTQEPDEAKTEPDRTKPLPSEPEPTTETAQAKPETSEKEKKDPPATTAKAEENGAGGEDETKPQTTEPAAVSASALKRIVRPVSGGRYSSKFGYRTNPITNVYSFHTGLDIAVAHGTQIVAAYRGTVDRIGRDARAGNYIVLSHAGGYETVYCHCSRILARRGDTVREGEAIALVGSTGWSTGPHLHFELRRNGERLDPYPILEHEV